MTRIEINKIRQIAAKAELEIIDTLERELPKEIEKTNELFEFYYSCIAMNLIISLNKWRVDILTNTYLEEEDE